jgi:TPR repeat protein
MAMKPVLPGGVNSEASDPTNLERGSDNGQAPAGASATATPRLSAKTPASQRTSDHSADSAINVGRNIHADPAAGGSDALPLNSSSEPQLQVRLPAGSHGQVTLDPNASEVGSTIREIDQPSLGFLMVCAESGHAWAQTILGTRYQDGDGVKESEIRAEYWFQKAAKQGDVDAQFKLGLIYNVGYGVNNYLNQAVHWFRQAADQGHAAAQTLLARNYFRGDGVERDWKQAVYWYRKAAEQGDADAQKRLSYCYFKGWGVEKDIERAVHWAKKLAEQGNGQAQFELASRYFYGDPVEKDLKQAAYWYEKAAKQGHSNAQEKVGIMYAHGDGVEQNFGQAAYWLLQTGLSVLDDEKRFTFSGPWKEGLVKSILDALKKSPEFNGIARLDLSDFRFDQAGFTLIDQLIRLYPNIKTLRIYVNNDREYDQAHSIIEQIVTTLREENTSLTKMKFNRYIDAALQTRLDQLLEQNKVIGELRRYVLEHPAKTSDELPLEVLSQVVDKLIVHRIRRGDGKAETQAAVDEFLMGAQYQVLESSRTRSDTI